MCLIRSLILGLEKWYCEMLTSFWRRFKTMPSPETGVINVFTLDFGATRLIFLSSCDLWWLSCCCSSTELHRPTPLYREYYRSGTLSDEEWKGTPYYAKILKKLNNLWVVGRGESN